MALNNGKYKGAQLSLTINSVEYNMDLLSAVVDNEDSDNPTFAQLGSGDAVDWFLQVEAVSDYGSGSLWSYIWSNSGLSGVAFLVKPYGNSTATVSKPHFSGTLTIPNKRPVGGTANEDFTFEARFEITGTPTRVTS